MKRLEAMMEDEICEAATKIQSSYRGHSSRKDYSLGSLTNTPRSELEITPRTSCLAPAGATSNLGELDGLEFEEKAASDVKEKLLQIQKKATQITQTLGQLAPVFAPAPDKDAPTSAAQHQRPFARIAAHKDLSSLSVAVIGHTEVSEAIVLQLCRSGVRELSLLHDGSSGDAEELSKRIKGGVDIKGFFSAESLGSSCNGANLLILCSDKVSHRKAVEAAAEEAGVAWVLVEEFRESASFRFQFFSGGVVDVLEHDVLAAPTMHHTQQSGVIQELEDVVSVVIQHAIVAFSGLIVQSVIKYWLGVGDVLGYAWYCATFNKLSTMEISELRTSLLPE